MKKTKKKLLVVLRHPSDSSDTLDPREGLRFPGQIAGSRLWCPPHSLGAVDVRSGRILPRVFEWTVVPGPDEIQ
jgi:hypothetical protein